MAAARKSRTARTATVLLVAGIGILSPSVGALPAWAQQSSVAPDDGGYFATPPPLDGTPVPSGDPKPDKNYELTKGCVTRNLGKDVVLKARPWGQDYLQIDKLQGIMKAATGSAGGGVKVAVIDTGVRQHPDFKNPVESGGDFVANPKNAAPGLEDCDGHGTEVAGIIAANTDETTGFKGVAPDATILSIRQSSQNYSEKQETSTPPSSTASSAPPGSTPPGSQIPGTNGGNSGQSDLGGTQPGQQGGGRQQSQPDTAGTLKTLAQAVVRAVDLKAAVINMSVDNCRPADGNISDGERMLQAAMRYAVDKNVVVIAAAGNVADKCPQNDQLNPQQPKSIVTPPWFADDVLSVGAIDRTGGVATFSVNGPWVSVAAPGTEITSLDPAEGSTGLANLTIEGGGSTEPTPIQGTSFAAPYVAGLAALIRAKYPTLSARAVMQRIKNTAQHPAAPGGRDNFVGYGVIDPMAALTSNVSDETMPSIKPIQSMADLPPADGRNWTPIVVALTGAGGGLIALLITVFVMHTARRRKSP